MDVQIGRDTVLALCAIAWADGKMDPQEAASIREAARQLALSAEDKSAVEAALASTYDLAQVETVRMNRLTRLFTYACGVWIAIVDGALSPEEERALTLLGDRVGLSEVARARAKSVVEAARASSGADQSIDLQKLRARLSAGLSQIGND
ncbi:MAG: TerB family tellurite resistance protein [Polyangiaceae bacterium]